MQGMAIFFYFLILFLNLSPGLFLPGAAQESRNVPADNFTNKESLAQKEDLAQIQTLVENGALISAREEIEKLCLENPRNWQYWLWACRIYQQMGLTSFAINGYEKVRLLRPSLNEPLIQLSGLYLENLSTELALALAEQAVSRDSESLEARLALTQALVACQSIQTAQLEGKKLLSLAPQEPRVLHVLALVERASGDLPAARNYLRQALSLKPRSIGWHLEMAELAAQLGDYSEAEASLHQVLALDPQSFGALSSLAHLYEFDRHDYMAARAVYQRIEEMAPSSPEARAGAERCLAKQKDWALAVKNVVQQVISGLFAKRNR
jgi:tetratricopeptide (TPR) repeat protein